MSRIKKQGLEYFPMDTDILSQREVRRLMKREGDGAICVLLQTLCAIYRGEGYYVAVDDDFFEDLSDLMFRQETADVRRVIMAAIEMGLFDERLFREESILTNRHIQEQFLFCVKKRRNAPVILPEYNLIPTPTAETEAAEKPENPEDNTPAEKTENRAKTPECGPQNGINARFTYQSTQSKAKHSTAKQKEIPLQGSPAGSGATAKGSMPPPGGGATGREADPESAEEIYREKIAALKVPQDGLKRNYEGLLLNLRQHRIPLQSQYAIILKCNFGLIGHPVWRGFCELRKSSCQIRQPDKYLLSLCAKG